MNGNYSYIDDTVLRKYIKEHFSLKDLYTGSNYEIVCALLMKSLFENIYHSSCLIGFKCKTSYDYKNHVAITNSQLCRNFFKVIADKDTPIDFCISPIESFDKNRNKIFGWTFQAKRFGHFQNEKDTEGLIKYLCKIKRSYSKSDSALVIFFDGSEKISPKKISIDERLNDFPFEKVFFIHINNNSNGFWYVKLGQLWPISGCNVYKAIEAIKDGVLENVSSTYKDYR